MGLGFCGLGTSVVPFSPSHYGASFRRTSHPVIVAIRDNKDYTKVLLYSYYTTITGWGVLLRSPS